MFATHVYTLEYKRIRGDLNQLFRFINQGGIEGLGLNTNSRKWGVIILNWTNDVLTGKRESTILYIRKIDRGGTTIAGGYF